MARIVLNFPEEKIIFSTSLSVRIGDINYGNHLSNDAVLSLCHEARVQWLAAMNYTELNIESLGLIMADAAIVFRSEARHGYVLSIDVAIDDVLRSSFDLMYKMVHNEKVVAIVKTGMVFYDYTLHKVCTCPDLFLQKVHR